MNGTAYQGDGQVVAVADTGFDKGSTSDVHIRPSPAAWPSCTRWADRPARRDDPDGHGTHVCGSVLGDGTSATMGGAIQGTAPRARLLLQSLIDSVGGLGGIPADLTDLFEPPYGDDGARVHTELLGRRRRRACPTTQSAREIDDFVWNHPDLVICFAAGNDGDRRQRRRRRRPGSVGSRGGGQELHHGRRQREQPARDSASSTYGSLGPSDFPSRPIHDDRMANDPEGMAAFSSRGPTQEGRFKPDVVAPGTCILSTHSRNAPAATTFGTSSDADYFFDSGTSMATPLVAGCAAVLRETLVKNGTPTPSAALIKALLINGAVELTGQYSPSEAGPSPNNNSGFGRVNLLGSVILPGPESRRRLRRRRPAQAGRRGHHHRRDPREAPAPGNAAGGRRAVRPLGVGTMGLGATFKITLVWSDPAGRDAAERPRPDRQGRQRQRATRQHGHGARGSTASTTSSRWSGPTCPPGDAKITIRAFRITRFPQPYAYAWRIS